jgi:hypothetical protein
LRWATARTRTSFALPEVAISLDRLGTQIFLLL